MLKLAFLSTENPYNPQNNGGIGTYTGIISQGLARLGHQVHCITIGEAASYIVEPNLMLHSIPPAQSRYTFFMGNMQLFSQKANEVKSIYGLDLVESPEWLAQGFTTSFEKTIPVVTRLHTPLFLIEELIGQKIYLKSAEINCLEKEQAHNSCAVTSPSVSLSRIVEERWNIKSKVIANPINIDTIKQFAISNTSKNLIGDFILFMGRLEFRKGVFILAMSLRDILPYFPNLKVVFCGQDSLYKRRSIKSQILEICKGFEDRLIFIPHANFDNKISLMKQARLLVLPSLWENFSYVALEAMSLGKTIIATNVGGFSEIIENGVSGYLVTPNSPSALAEIVNQVISGNLRQTGSYASQRIQSKFSIDILAQRFAEYYDSLI